MSQHIRNALPELIEAGLISEDQADAIHAHYDAKGRGSSQQRLLVIFGSLGALLVGLGLILIVAHNWDQLAKWQQLVLAFVPTLLGQGIAGYVLTRKADQQGWREGSATFLFLALGSSLSLISQIYHLPDDLGSYLLTWMLLCLPLMYLLRSSLASMLYIVGITAFACEVGYVSSRAVIPAWSYWVLLAGALPFYLRLVTHNPQSNAVRFHHWLMALSLVITGGIAVTDDGIVVPVLYMSLFGLLYLLGDSAWFATQRGIGNAYRSLGSLGSSFVLIVMSFADVWESIGQRFVSDGISFLSGEAIYSMVLTLAAMALLVQQLRSREAGYVDPLKALFALFLIIFQLGIRAPILGAVLINAILLLIGILTIRNGVQTQRLGVLNYGLLLITTLIVCRFFDVDLPFVFKGLVFVLIGAGFFGANIWMIRRGREAEEL